MMLCQRIACLLEAEWFWVLREHTGGRSIVRLCEDHALRDEPVTVADRCTVVECQKAAAAVAMVSHSGSRATQVAIPLCHAHGQLAEDQPGRVPVMWL